MINLLPPQGKKRVIIDYWIRATSVLFTLVGICALVTCALLLPTYFYLSYQSQALQNTGSDIADEVMSFKELENEINVANDISELLIDSPEYIEASDVITEINTFAGEQIFVSNVTIEKQAGQIETVRVNGVANNRAALVQFRDDAETNEYFSKVDLPLSNLAQNQDIPFSLLLEPSELLQTKL